METAPYDTSCAARNGSCVREWRWRSRHHCSDEFFAREFLPRDLAAAAAFPFSPSLLRKVEAEREREREREIGPLKNERNYESASSFSALSFIAPFRSRVEELRGLLFVSPAARRVDFARKSSFLKGFADTESHFVSCLWLDSELCNI